MPYITYCLVLQHRFVRWSTGLLKLSSNMEVQQLAIQPYSRRAKRRSGLTKPQGVRTNIVRRVKRQACRQIWAIYRPLQPQEAVLEEAIWQHLDKLGKTLPSVVYVRMNTGSKETRGRNQAFFSFISATRRSLQTVVFENFHPILNQIQPKFNGLVLGIWPNLPQTRYPGDRQTDRQTDRAGKQTNRQTDKQTNKQTNKQRWKHNLLAKEINK